MWYLGEQPAGSSGYVTLQVVVNENARQSRVVKNQAYVQVNGDPEQPTEIPRNPLPSEVPKTGDEGRPGLWLMAESLCLAALSAAAGILIRRRRKSK